ncbi:hypothetical protein GJ633_01820 [Halorubrum sp. CBA1125]|uniref:hypothetical protein n=1 Tax=Halorubrum sp. CBA1125 TaxID=2668072 RepID=UPI0012E83874|nr:hypothetical protein [Halorubrum sp. CBA1125]MUW13525.1 hypothetical protein [Halorubrum sp. CBA1125]
MTSEPGANTIGDLPERGTTRSNDVYDTNGPASTEAGALAARDVDESVEVIA